MPKLKTIAISEVQGVHPAIQPELVKLHALQYSASGDDIRAKGLLRLLALYPISVAPTEEGYAVVAGFRQYELLCVHRADPAYQSEQVLERIPVLVHANKPSSDLIEMARDDLTGSVLLFSLGTKVTEQLRLIRELVPQTYDDFPKYNRLTKQPRKAKTKSTNE